MRLRLLVPGRRRRRGLGRLNRRAAGWIAAPLIAAALIAAGVVAVDERTEPLGELPRPAVPTPTAPRTPPDERGLVLGLTEANPALVAPGAVPGAFAPWRDRVAQLRPRYARVLVDWEKVQPLPGAPPSWSTPGDGCQRGVAPCAPYAGITDLLRAIRARQAVDGGWEVVVTFYGVPDWAAEPGAAAAGRAAARRGCRTSMRARQPDLAAYRALVRSLREAARAVGVALRWWSPWNEANHPAFLAPQREGCAIDGRPLTPAAYARIVRALSAELGAGEEIVLGELAGYSRPRRSTTTAAEFAAALPRDVACAGPVWAQHAYVAAAAAAPPADSAAPPPDPAGPPPDPAGPPPDPAAPSPDPGAPPADPAAPPADPAAPPADTAVPPPVPAAPLEGDADPAGAPGLLAAVVAALDAHDCPRRHRLWITETGAGGPRSGAERPTDDASLAAACGAMAGALARWGRDDRVDAAFQYTFREDPAFPVGLADAALSRLYPTYAPWRAWSEPGPAPALAC